MHTYLNKQGLVFVALIRLNLDDTFGFSLKGKVSPEGLLQGRCIAPKLVCILFCHLANSESPAVMRACKGHVAQLRLELVFFVFKVHLVLLSPAGTSLCWELLWMKQLGVAD